MKRLFVIAKLAGLALIVCVASVLVLRLFWMRDIGALPSRQAYNATQFEFRFGNATRFVDDPHNQMQWCVNRLPDQITVKDSVRTIIHTTGPALYRSWGGSMRITDRFLVHLEPFGAYHETTRFRVDSTGKIHEDNSD